MREEGRDIKATVQVGKKGITKELIEEIKAQLKKRKRIKISFLKNADRENFKGKVEEIAQKVGAEIEEIRGFTFILRKK